MIEKLVGRMIPRGIDFINDNQSRQAFFYGLANGFLALIDTEFRVFLAVNGYDDAADGIQVRPSVRGANRFLKSLGYQEIERGIQFGLADNQAGVQKTSYETLRRQIMGKKYSAYRGWEKQRRSVQVVAK